MIKPTPKYKVGDILRHKAAPLDSPKMVVAYVEEEDFEFIIITYKMSWIDANNYIDAEMYEHELVKLAADNNPIEGEAR